MIRITRINCRVVLFCIMVFVTAAPAFSLAAVGGTWGATDMIFPCFAFLDDCTDDYRLLLGAGYGKYGVSRTATADALHDVNQCGDKFDVGDLPSNEDLWVYVDNAYAIDTVRDDGGVVKFIIDLFEYEENDCSGGIDRNFTADTATCTVNGTDANVTWQTPWSESYGDCTAGYGDPGDCHQPDIRVSYPGTLGTYCYKYYIWVRVCDSDGTNCTSDYDYGYFVAEWVSP